MAFKFMYQISCNINKTVLLPNTHVDKYCFPTIAPIVKQKSRNYSRSQSLPPHLHNSQNTKIEQKISSDHITKLEFASAETNVDKLSQNDSYKSEKLQLERSTSKDDLNTIYHLQDSLPTSKKKDYADVFQRLFNRYKTSEAKLVPHLQPSSLRPYGSLNTTLFSPVLQKKSENEPVSDDVVRRKSSGTINKVSFLNAKRDYCTSSERSKPLDPSKAKESSLFQETFKFILAYYKYNIRGRSRSLELPYTETKAQVEKPSVAVERVAHVVKKNVTASVHKYTLESDLLAIKKSRLREQGMHYRHDNPTAVKPKSSRKTNLLDKSRGKINNTRDIATDVPKRGRSQLEKCNQIIAEYRKLNPSTQFAISKKLESGSAEEREVVNKATKLVSNYTRYLQINKYGKSKSDTEMIKKEQPLGLEMKQNDDHLTVVWDNFQPNRNERSSTPWESYSEKIKTRSPKNKLHIVYPHKNIDIKIKNRTSKEPTKVNDNEGIIMAADVSNYKNESSKAPQRYAIPFSVLNVTQQPFKKCNHSLITNRYYQRIKGFKFCRNFNLTQQSQVSKCHYSTFNKKIYLKPAKNARNQSIKNPFCDVIFDTPPETVDALIPQDCVPVKKAKPPPQVPLKPLCKLYEPEDPVRSCPQSLCPQPRADDGYDTPTKRLKPLRPLTKRCDVPSIILKEGQPLPRLKKRPVEEPKRVCPCLPCVCGPPRADAGMIVQRQCLRKLRIKKIGNSFQPLRDVCLRRLPKVELQDPPRLHPIEPCLLQVRADDGLEHPPRKLPVLRACKVKEVPGKVPPCVDLPRLRKVKICQPRLCKVEKCEPHVTRADVYCKYKEKAKQLQPMLLKPENNNISIRTFNKFKNFSTYTNLFKRSVFRSSDTADDDGDKEKGVADESRSKIFDINRKVFDKFEEDLKNLLKIGQWKMKGLTISKPSCVNPFISLKCGSNDVATRATLNNFGLPDFEVLICGKRYQSTKSKCCEKPALRKPFPVMKVQVTCQPRRKKGLLKRFIDYFKARPNCPKPGDWKRQKLCAEARKKAAEAGLKISGECIHTEPLVCQHSSPCPVCSKKLIYVTPELPKDSKNKVENQLKAAEVKSKDDENKSKYEPPIAKVPDSFKPKKEKIKAKKGGPSAKAIKVSEIKPVVVEKSANEKSEPKASEPKIVKAAELKCENKEDCEETCDLQKPSTSGGGCGHTKPGASGGGIGNKRLFSTSCVHRNAKKLKPGCMKKPSCPKFKTNCPPRSTEPCNFYIFRPCEAVKPPYESFSHCRKDFPPVFVDEQRHAKDKQNYAAAIITDLNNAPGQIRLRKKFQAMRAKKEGEPKKC